MADHASLLDSLMRLSDPLQVSPATRHDQLPSLSLSERNQPRAGQAIDYIITMAAKHAGLPPVHPDMLHHSCSCSFANRGYELTLIQDHLGHRDPKHTAHHIRIAARPSMDRGANDDHDLEEVCYTKSLKGHRQLGAGLFGEVRGG
jgi:integrase